MHFETRSHLVASCVPQFIHVDTVRAVVVSSLAVVRTGTYLDRLLSSASSVSISFSFVFPVISQYVSFNAITRRCHRYGISIPAAAASLFFAAQPRIAAF